MDACPRKLDCRTRDDENSYGSGHFCMLTLLHTLRFNRNFVLAFLNDIPYKIFVLKTNQTSCKINLSPHKFRLFQLDIDLVIYLPFFNKVQRFNRSLIIRRKKGMLTKLKRFIRDLYMDMYSTYLLGKGLVLAKQ